MAQSITLTWTNAEAQRIATAYGVSDIAGIKAAVNRDIKQTVRAFEEEQRRISLPPITPPEAT